MASWNVLKEQRGKPMGKLKQLSIFRRLQSQVGRFQFSWPASMRGKCFSFPSPTSAFTGQEEAGRDFSQKNGTVTQEGTRAIAALEGQQMGMLCLFSPGTHPGEPCLKLGVYCFRPSSGSFSFVFFLFFITLIFKSGIGLDMWLSCRMLAQYT